MSAASSLAIPVALDNAGVLQATTVDEDMTKITILPGHEPDYSACTFCLNREDHTLGNALRWIIMKDADVEYCGYSAPHPAEDKIHLRIQMYDNLSAVDCLRRALANLRDLLTSIKGKYEHSLHNDTFIQEEDIDVREAVAAKIREKRAQAARATATATAPGGKGKAPAGSTDVDME